MDPSNKVTGRCIWNTYWYFNNETGNFKKWHDIKNNSCLVSWYIRFNESGDWEILPSSEIDANTSHNYAKPSHVLLRSHQKIIHHHLTIDIICIYIYIICIQFSYHPYTSPFHHSLPNYPGFQGNHCTRAGGKGSTTQSCMCSTWKGGVRLKGLGERMGGWVSWKVKPCRNLYIVSLDVYIYM